MGKRSDLRAMMPWMGTCARLNNASGELLVGESSGTWTETYLRKLSRRR